MQYTQQFIEDAVAGGWVLERSDRTSEEEQIAYLCLEPSYILLDPLAWQAVGKTREWMKTTGSYHGYEPEIEGAWVVKMHRFIDHLCNGDSIETALSKLA